MRRLKGRGGIPFIDLTALRSFSTTRPQAQGARWPLLAKMASKGIIAGFLISWLGGVALSLASTPSEEDSLYRQVLRLSQEVRCPVCIGQSIADSDAPESLALKRFISKELSEGTSEEGLRTKLRSLYGENILFAPPLTSTTFILWLGPFGLLFIFCLLVGYKLFKAHRHLS